MEMMLLNSPLILLYSAPLVAINVFCTTNAVIRNTAFVKNEVMTLINDFCVLFIGYPSLQAVHNAMYCLVIFSREYSGNSSIVSGCVRA